MNGVIELMSKSKIKYINIIATAATDRQDCYLALPVSFWERQEISEDMWPHLPVTGEKTNIYLDFQCTYWIIKRDSPKSDTAPSVENDMEKIRKFIERGEVFEARNYLSSIPVGFSNKIDNWRKVLSKPKARQGIKATGRDIRREFSWIKENSIKYKGKWIALKDGKLLGSDESRFVLHQTLKQAGLLKGTLFFKVNN